MARDGRVSPGVVLAALLCAAGGAFAGEGGTVRFDFETGDLQGWRVIEGEFGKLVCEPRDVRNHQGKLLLTTLQREREADKSDAMTGVIESPVFVLDAAQMTLRVGGGRHATTYVALCTLDGKEHLTARGANSVVMREVGWDAPQLVGKPVFLRIVDRHEGGWGHVTFDDFVARGRWDPAATAAREKAAQGAAFRQRADAVLGLARPLRPAIADLAETFGDRYPRGGEFLKRLEGMEQRGVAASPNDLAKLRDDLLALQREALLASPIVNGQPILFVVRHQYRPDHHNTETMFQTGEINTGSFQGGGALKAIRLGEGGKVTTLLEAPKGVARDPDVSFDGKKILFSMRRDVQDDYHIYEMNADGTGLKPLTFGRGVTDIDPLYLPDGRIAFSSTRELKYCMCNRHIMANLFRMEADGANLTQISHNTLHDGHGSLTPDGRILYDRWEYVDRNFGDAQGVWTCNPDGTNHALYWGNNTPSPGVVLDPRIVPGTGLLLATFSSCHDRPWGAIALVDRRRGLEGKTPVLRTWPASAINLVMVGNYDTFTRVSPRYEDPYPLSDRYFLCSRQVRGEQMGLFLIDVFGNEVLLHTELPGCFDPMPVAPRPRPGVIPDRIHLAQSQGYFYIYDVYVGTGMERVPRGTVRFLRVVQSPPKRFWTHPAWDGGTGQQAPGMAWNDFNNKRILGTVPVEADGSAYFAVPSDRFVYFQLLDENGMMVQTMRSGTLARPGEVTGCVGCHENRLAAVPNSLKKAITRAPSPLAPWHGESRLFSYTAEVQPVFDRHCVRCHDFGKPAGGKLNLAGDLTLLFNVSYTELRRKNLVKVIGAGPADILPPYSWGSHRSKLVEVLRKGSKEHQDLKLDAEGFDRIVTWIDINAPYYPDYASVYPKNLHGRSPLDTAQLAALTRLTGMDLARQSAVPLISFTRPELSPCLAKLEENDGPKHAEALAIIRAGKEMLAKCPREDMPGARLDGLDVERQKRYEAQVQLEAEARRAILAGKRVYPAGRRP